MIGRLPLILTLIQSTLNKMNSSGLFIALNRCMKNYKLSLTVSLLIISLMSFIANNGTEVFRFDRLEHFMVSVIVMAIIYMLYPGDKLRRVLLAFVGASLIGLLKEYTDPQFEVFDIVANTAGLTMLSLTLLFDSLGRQQTARRRVYTKRRHTSSL